MFKRKGRKGVKGFLNNVAALVFGCFVASLWLRVGSQGQPGKIRNMFVEMFLTEKNPKKSNSITLTTYLPLSPPSPSRRSLQPTTIPRSTIAPGKECSCMSSTFLVTSSSFHILFSHNKAKKMQDTNHHAM